MHLRARPLLAVVIGCAVLPAAVAGGVLYLDSSGANRHDAAATSADAAGHEARPQFGTEGTSAREAAVEALLDRHAAAFLDRDRAGFLADLDPAAPQFASAQGAEYDNASAVPFASWSYELVRSDALARSAQPRDALGAPAFTAEVDTLYRLAGHDTEPVRVPGYLTFVLRGGAWRIASDSDGAAAGPTASVQLWDLGHVSVLQSGTSIVLGLGPRAELRAYQHDADAAVQEVTRVWGTAWARSAVVEVPATQAQMAQLLGADPAAWTRIAAVTTGERGAATDAAAADRVIVNPDAFRGLGPLERHVVMTHELTHVAGRAWTRTWTPAWLSEGVADWTGYLDTGVPPRTAAPELRADVLAGRVPGTLPGDDEFGTTSAGLSQAYEMGWLACRMIAEHWGQDRLVAFYRAVGAQPPPGVTPQPQAVLSDALRSVLGTGVEAFTAMWSRYVVAELE